MLSFDHPAQAQIKIEDREAAIVKCIPEPRTRVAIVGFADSSRDHAPYHDSTWEVWSLNQAYRFIPRADRWFEMHQDFLHDQVPGTDYLTWLRESRIPVYMIDTHTGPGTHDIPTSVRYPIERMTEFFQRRYFTSSIAFMTALAIAEGFKEIGFWGVDLIADTEYAQQRPNMEWLLGVAGGLGRTITVDPRSALLKSLYLYGYEDGPAFALEGITPEMLDFRLIVLDEKINWLKTTLNAHEGMLLETRGWRAIMSRLEAGVKLTESHSEVARTHAVAEAIQGFSRDLGNIEAAHVVQP